MWTLRKNPGSDGKFICSVYDSNGSSSFRNMYLEKVFNLLSNDSVKYYVVHMSKLNTNDTNTINEWFSKLSIPKKISSKGYCSTLSIMLILDVLCTGYQIYSPGHLERLMNDLQKRNPKDPIDEKHRLASALYGRHLAYFAVVKCIEHHKKNGTRPLWWSKFSYMFGPWENFDISSIETVTIKRVNRLGKLGFRNITKKEEFLFEGV
jgi:hypothetical protein